MAATNLPKFSFPANDTAALTLEHAIVYVWREAKLARTCEEHEDFEITLKLLGQLHRGRSGPGLLNLACAYVTGLPHAKYVYRRAERAEFMRLDFARSIPDYDYSLEPRIPDCAPVDGRRHFGNNFASRGMDTPAIKAAAAKLGISKAAIYSRLSDGWTWERAIAEPRISKRGPYRKRLQRDIAPSIKLIQLYRLLTDSLRGSTKDLGKLPVDTQIANSPTLNTNEAPPLTLARIEQLREAGRLSWSESVRAKRKQRLAEIVGRKLLDSVSDYLYGEAQGARNAFERDCSTLALHLLAAVRRGDHDPFLSASYAAFGSSFPIYVQRRSEREDFFHAEFRDVSSQRAGASLPAKNAMVAQRVPRVEPNPISPEDGNQSCVRIPLGDRQTANRRELASVIPWPESPGVGDIASG